MQTMIDRLNAVAGTHGGAGNGDESGPFTASITIEPLVGTLGTSIAYRAVDPAGAQLHEERTTLAHDMLSGRLTLYVLCEELAGVGLLSEVSDGVFNNGAGIDGFELQIDITVSGDELTYTWSWAPPGQALVEQSRAVVPLTA